MRGSKLKLAILGILWGLPGLVTANPSVLSSRLQDRLYLRVDHQNTSLILITEDLRRLYEPQRYSNLWVQQGRITESGLALREILQSADRYGLKPSSYWSSLLESLFPRLNERNEITFELVMTDAYLRFARDLANGQILDPDLIDEDIKMARKAFNHHGALAEAARNPRELRKFLESLAPQHVSYQRLVGLRERLRQLQQQNSWATFVDPGGDIRPGQSHGAIPEIKKRLSDLGYGLAQNRTAVFDSELQESLRQFQSLNGLPANRNLNRTFYAALAPGLEERIARIDANLEKFRWFPRQWENRYLYVNLAFQEMSVIENQRAVLQMRTVNGRPTRRTPTLRDEMRFLELNPTWTVPHSIATKDKLKTLQRDPGEISRQNMIIRDRSRSVIDPFSIQWDLFDRNNFPFELVQQPGPQNALGLVKFPLTNPWAIFLHDTNEPHLMSSAQRLRSSGCVRLERAFDFVQYLLQDQPSWPLSRVRAETSPEFRIQLRQRLPVYFIYQTVDVTASGQVRMAADEYKQDARLRELFQSRGSHEKF